jgi:rare lipoprotein A
LFMAACAAREAPHVPAPVATKSPVSNPIVLNEIYRATGIASWYGRELHGKKSADNDIFDMYALSGAHRTLPLGTVLRVTNLDNSKTIKVRINDRGPFVKSRMLELSYGAAKELEFIAQGVARVQIETVDEVEGPVQYAVQAAMYAEEENARILKHRISKKFTHVTTVVRETNNGRFYRVLVGSYVSEELAEQIAAKLKLEGLEPLVVRKDEPIIGK